MENIQEIDLGRFVQTGEGANGLSYDSLDDSNLMLKLYNESYDLSAIITEHDVAGKVYDLGVPSPEPGKLVKVGNRTGILFRRIIGKRSFARAIADEPDRVEQYTAEFARCCKKLHSTELQPGTFPDAKSDFLKMLDSASYLAPETRNTVRHYLTYRVPDCRTALHGDMHVGNLLTTLPKGRPMSDPHEIYFIDLGYFSIGCPLLDVGMLHNICIYSDDSFLEHDFHFGRQTALKVWDSFAEEYFFGPEKLAEKWFGSGASEEDVNRGMIPYAIIKLLLVGYNLGFLPEGYMAFINRNIHLMEN